MKKKLIIFLIILILFISNFIWSIFGILIGLIHVPYSIHFNSEYQAIIIRVKTTGILDIIPGYKNWRGITVGNTIVINSREEYGDELHEAIHVEQFMRYPGIFPILNIYETYKNGYRQNRFEIEAYNRAGNKYYP